MYLLVKALIIYCDTIPPKYALIEGNYASEIKENFLANYKIDFVYYYVFLYLVAIYLTNSMNYDECFVFQFSGFCLFFKIY